MKHLGLMTLFLSLFFFQAKSQCNDPVPPGLNCETAPILNGDQLDGYCSATTSLPNNQAPPNFCATAFDNVQWIGFVAGSTSLQLSITEYDCQGSFSPPSGGLQAQIFGLFGSCSTNAFFPVSNCNTDAIPNNTIILTSDQPLILGNTYYIIIDGWASDQCGYTINILQGSVDPPSLPDPGPIDGPSLVCPEQFTSYSVPPIIGATNYEWTVTNGFILDGQGDPSILVVWNNQNATAGEVCVTASNALESSNTVCTVIEIEEIPPTIIDTAICQGQVIIYEGTPIFASGTYPFNFTSVNGCDSTVILEVEVIPPDFTVIQETLCVGDTYQYIEPDGTPATYVAPDVDNDFFTLVYENQFGCDSTVSFFFEIFPAFDAMISEDQFLCPDSCVLLFSAVFTPGPFIWEGPNGFTSSDLIINVCTPGDYYFTLGEPDNPCAFKDTVTVFGPVLDLETTNSPCFSNGGTAMLDLQGNLDTVSIEWSTGDTDVTFLDGLGEGIYSVSVTSEACYQELEFEIEQEDSCEVVISGFIFDDTPTEACDPATVQGPVAGIPVLLLPDEILIETDIDGSYEFVVDPGQYTVVAQLPSSWLPVCPTDASIDLDLPQQGTISEMNNFYIKTAPGLDLSASAKTGNVFQGFTQWYRIRYCNVGSEPANATFTFTHDPLQFNFSSAVPATSYNFFTQTATWILEDIQPDACEDWLVRVQLPYSVPQGTIIEGCVEITADQPETNLTDNLDCWQQEVKGFSLGKPGGEDESNALASQNSEQPEAFASINSETIKVRPNPFKNELTIDISLSAPSIANLRLVDVNGRTVHFQEEQFAEGKHQVAISSLAQLPVGVYWLNVETPFGVHVEKVVKVKP